MKNHVYVIGIIGGILCVCMLGCNGISGINEIEFGDTDSPSDTSIGSDTSTGSDTNIGSDTSSETGTVGAGSDVETNGTDDSDSGDTETGTHAAACTPGIEDHIECSVNGDVVSVDNCGEVIEVVQDCTATQNCEMGVCTCPAGWTGVSCSVPVIYANTAVSNAADHTGRSWEQAVGSLQTALSLAEGFSSCEIWVAKGYYVPGTARTDTFQLLEDVHLYGGFAGNEKVRAARDIETNKTILSGDINGDDGPDFVNNDENAYHVVTGANNAVLDGFTVTGGNADYTETNTDGNTVTTKDSFGGGMYNKEVNLAVGNCTFLSNHAYSGGGIYNNTVLIKIKNSVVSRNKASYAGGGLYSTNKGTLDVINCSFDENIAEESSGGGLQIVHGEPAIITGCTFTNNTAAICGGGIDAKLTDIIVQNSIFYGNTASIGGGLKLSSTESPEILGCTFIENFATKKGGGVSDGAVAPNYPCSAPTITNSIFWNNTAGESAEQLNSCSSSATSISYSVVEAGCDSVENAICGVGNASADPRFVNEAAGDFRLDSNSPCIDAGDNDSIGKDLTDLDGDKNTGENIPYDLDGNIREMDGNGDQNIEVDMGAFEYVP